jgi:multidrug resistance efflux pump
MSFNNNPLFFRTLRVLLLGGVLFGLMYFLWTNIFFIHSNKAYINGDILHLRAPIAGIVSLEELHPGMRLTQGMRVFTVKNPLYGNMEILNRYLTLLSLQQSEEIKLSQDRVQWTQYGQDYARAQKLYAVGGESQQESEHLETQKMILEKAIPLREAFLSVILPLLHDAQSQTQSFKHAEVKAPYDGVVWGITVESGEQVAVNDTVLAMIVPDRLWVDAFFSERYASKLKPGKSVNISIKGMSHHWEGEIFSVRAGVGRVIFDRTVVEPPPLVQRQLAVRIRMKSPENFASNEFFGLGRSVIVRLRD